MKSTISRRDSAFSSKGFSLVEMLVVLVVAGILMSVAIPTISRFARSSSVSIASKELASAFTLARSYAIKHRTSTYIVFATPVTFFYNSGKALSPDQEQAIPRMLSAYAVIARQSQMDHPGEVDQFSYIREWTQLPAGSLLVPFNQKLFGWVRDNDASNVIQLDGSPPERVREFPFPVQYGEGGGETLPLSYIRFNAQGLIEYEGKILIAEGSYSYPMNEAGIPYADSFSDVEFEVDREGSMLVLRFFRQGKVRVSEPLRTDEGVKG